MARGRTARTRRTQAVSAPAAAPVAAPSALIDSATWNALRARRAPMPTVTTPVALSADPVGDLGAFRRALAEITGRERPRRPDLSAATVSSPRTALLSQLVPSLAPLGEPRTAAEQFLGSMASLRQRRVPMPVLA